MMSQIIALLEKDLKSEYRLRYSITSVFLFVLISATIIIFCTKNIDINTDTFAGLLWVVMFFGSMAGLSKSFVSEEERGTAIFLKLMAKPSSIYFSKLLFNSILCIAINFISLFILFLFIGGIKTGSLDLLILVMIFSGIGLAAASTIISAIIAKASSKNALFPVLSAPALMPLVIVGLESTVMALEGSPFNEIKNNLIIMLGFSGAVIAISYILFDIIWEE
jgi:heme exporter protein B